jgi:hypothetical protein
MMRIVPPPKVREADFGEEQWRREYLDLKIKEHVLIPRIGPVSFVYNSF